MPTLLEKAKALQTHTPSEDKKITEEHIELVLAYLKGEITNTQISKTLGSQGTAYVWTTRVMQKLMMSGEIEIKRSK